MTATNRLKPDSKAARRGPGIVFLPPGGSDLPVPAVPDEVKHVWSKTQRARWRELWKSPQATQWDDSVGGTVALLVTYESALLQGQASAWMAQEARYASDALGLTPKSMAALGWVVSQ